MPKKSIMIFLFIFFTFYGIAYGQSDDRYFENGGNFSICYPRGWTVYDFPGLKYKIFYDSPINGFSANIIIVDEIFEGSLDEYLRLNNQNMEIVNPDAELVSKTSIRTNNGLNGWKQIFLNANSSRLLKQYFYFFSNSNVKYVITCTTLNNSNRNYDKIFDESIKTFEFIWRSYR